MAFSRLLPLCIAACIQAFAVPAFAQHVVVGANASTSLAYGHAGEMLRYVFADVSGASTTDYVIGVPVTFTISGGGHFEGGSRSVTAVTGDYGRAIVSPSIVLDGPVGAYKLTATALDGAASMPLYVVGPTRTSLAYQAPAPPFIVQGVTSRLTFVGLPCTVHVPIGFTMSVTVDGVGGIAGREAADASGVVTTGCDDQGNATRDFKATFVQGFGAHDVVASFRGNVHFDPSSSPAVRTQPLIAPIAGTTARGGAHWSALGLWPAPFGNLLAGCPDFSMAPTDALPPMPRATFPWGGFSYQLPATCRPAASNWVNQVLVELDTALPAGTTVVAYGAGPGESAPSWHALQATVAGKRAQVVLDASLNAGTAGGSVLLAFALPVAGSAPANYQDLWWGGAAQNGWGLGITQHDDRIFATLFAYAPDGAPRWWVVPGGTWNAGFTTFHGNVYRPHMVIRDYSQGGNYTVVGEPVGTMDIAFRDASHATMRYAIEGVNASRDIERQPIGRDGATFHWSFADMWWHGPPGGSGWTFAQQGSELFAVNHFYNNAGDTSWSVFPGGGWSAPDTFLTQEYHTQASDWLHGYDPAALRVTGGDARVFTFTDYSHMRIDYGCYVTPDDWGCGTELLQRQPF